jgi:hypothetical protein
MIKINSSDDKKNMSFQYKIIKIIYFILCKVIIY